jgi:hypothetical protein
VQLADGTVRKLDAAKIARIDFADGTTWKPSAPPAEVPAAAAAPAPAAAPQAAGAPPAQPAPVQAPAPVPQPAAPAAAAAPGAQPPQAPPPAASVQAVAPVAPPSAPPAAAAAPAAAVAGSPAAPQPVPPAAAASPARSTAMTIPAEKLDTVHLASGGRVRCLVVEEGPEGVVARLVDGTERRFAPGQVARIDWADGTRSDLSRAPPQPPAPAPAAR